MAQPRASNPISAIAPARVAADEHLAAVAAHRVVALRGRVERGRTRAVPRTAAAIQDGLLIQIAQVVEHQAKKLRTRSRVSPSASISAMRRVDAEAGARGAVQPQPAHQRLGAMVAGAHRDALPVQQGRDVVRVRALHREADHPAAILRRADHVQARDGRQPRQRVLGQRRLMRGDRVVADALDEADRGAQADRLQDGGRAGLELVRDLGPGAAPRSWPCRSCRRRP